MKDTKKLIKRSKIVNALNQIMDLKGFERMVQEDFNDDYAQVISAQILMYAPDEWKLNELDIMYGVHIQVFVGENDDKHIDTYWRDKIRYFTGQDNAIVRTLKRKPQVVHVYFGLRA